MATTIEPLAPEDMNLAQRIASGTEADWLFPGCTTSHRDAVIHIIKGPTTVTKCGKVLTYISKSTVSAQLWESRTYNTSLCRRCASKMDDPAISAKFEAQRQIVAAITYATPPNVEAAKKSSGVLRNLRKRADLGRVLAAFAGNPQAADWCRIATWASTFLDNAAGICTAMLADDVDDKSFVTLDASRLVAADAVQPPLCDRMDLKAFISGSGYHYARRNQALNGFVEMWRLATWSASGENPVELWMLANSIDNLDQLAHVPALAPLENETAANAAARSWNQHVEQQLHPFKARLDDAYRDLIELDHEPTVRLHLTKPAELDDGAWAPMLTKYPTSKGPRSRTEWLLPATCAALVIQKGVPACTVVGYEPTDEYTTVALKLWQPGTNGSEGMLSYAARLASLVT